MKVSYAVEMEEIKRAFAGRESEESKMVREFLEGTQPKRRRKSVTGELRCTKPKTYKIRY